MYKQIEGLLGRYGYENVTLNVGDIYLALRQESGQCYAVVTLDETKGTRLSKEQFFHVSEQIRGFIKQRGCVHSRFLYLLISDDDSSASRLFKNYECFWRIVPSRCQLMVFEWAEEAFMVLRRPLEDLLEGYAYQKNSQRVYRENYSETGNYGKNDIRNVITRAIREKKLPLCNILIILINVLVFLYTDFFAVFRGDSAIDAGALGWQAVLEEGQWYRMISSMFIHLDSEHLFNNMLVLAYIGSCVELELGSFRYGILYIGSGLLAGGTSMVYNMMQNVYTVSVGASGAIFGTVGAILFIVLFHKGRKIQYNLRQIAFLAFFSLYGGFASQGVDNAAHFGGFLAGFVLAGLLTLGWKRNIENS